MESYHRYQSDLDNLNERIATIDSKFAEKQEEKQRTASTLQTVQASLQEAELQLKTRQTEFTEIEKQHTQLSAEATVLENLQRKLEGFGAGTKAILQGSLEALIQPGEVDVFSKHIQVDADYQQFCETVLGSLLESLVYSNTNRLASISSFLKEADIGKAHFLVPELRNQSRKSNKALKDAPLKPAVDLIRTSDSNLTDALADILSGSYYAESLDEAISYLKKHSDFDFEQIATKTGELITRHGSVSIGVTGGKSGSFLQRQNELRKLKEQIDAKEKELRAKNDELDTLVSGVDEKAREREELRDILQTVEREISNLVTEKSGLERNLSSNADRVSTYKKQLETLDLDKERQEQELVDVRSQLEASESELEEQKTLINRSEQNTSELRFKKEQVFEGLSKCQNCTFRTKAKAEFIPTDDC